MIVRAERFLSGWMISSLRRYDMSQYTNVISFRLSIANRIKSFVDGASPPFFFDCRSISNCWSWGTIALQISDCVFWSRTSWLLIFRFIWGHISPLTFGVTKFSTFFGRLYLWATRQAYHLIWYWGTQLGEEISFELFSPAWVTLSWL